MPWALNGTSVTLESGSGTISVSDITQTKFMQIIWHGLSGGGTALDPFLKFNTQSSTTNYSSRYSKTGASDTVWTSAYAPGDFGEGGYVYDYLVVVDMCVITTEEKLGIAQSSFDRTAGAGNAPGTVQIVFKYTDTSAITSVFMQDGNDTANAQVAGSNITVFGTD